MWVLAVAAFVIGLLCVVVLIRAASPAESAGRINFDIAREHDSARDDKAA